MKELLLFTVVAVTGWAFAAPVLPGYLTDPSMMKGSLAKDSGYQPPEQFKYPYISTYYVKPTVKVGESVKVSFYVTDFEQSKIRFLDDSHRFTAFLEYRLKGGESKTLTLKNLKSGDSAFNLGELPAGDYEMRIWVRDAKDRESHRVIHDFRVVRPSDLAIPVSKVYRMTEADLAAYGIRNDGDLERIVYVGDGKREVVKEKRAGVPGYTVTVGLDPKTGKLPWQAFSKASVVYDEGYDKAAVEADAVRTRDGIQKLIDDKSAAGFRKIVMLPGTYRVSHVKSITIPDRMTLDLGKAVLKLNAFTGASSLMVNLASTYDSHLVGGTLEGDYWTHDYAGSPHGSEWCSGFQLGGDCWYSSVDGVKVVDITGYGGQNGISKDGKGDLSFFLDYLPKFAPGGLDPKTGEVRLGDQYRFTTDFKDLKKILEKGRTRLQVSKFLGYQGRATRSWQMTVAWYDAQKQFISSETAWQYREMWIPANAAFLRVSVEDESVKAANDSALRLTAMRVPVNCVVARCRFENCRCVGYAASAMKNHLFAGNFFTRSGESAARCAFDAEDGWDQMQDVYFFRNVFRDNPMNNSILTCAGHNFILEKNEGDVYFWGRTHSPCVSDNDIGRATYRCDSRLRSGYGRFDGNRYRKGVELGVNEGKDRADNWDYVLSGLELDGSGDSFDVEVGKAGRMVNCTFRNMGVSIANAYACRFENCHDASTYKPVPSGRWFEVTVRDSTFKRFSGTYDWTRCHIANSKLESFNGAKFTANGCDLTNCAFYGFDRAKISLLGCRLDGTKFSGGYWQKPSDFIFKDCNAAVGEGAELLKIGLYGIGRVGFDGCTVTGRGRLVNIFDIRPTQHSPSEPNPDDEPAAIALRGTKWKSEADSVIVYGKDNRVSKKRLTVFDKGKNTCPKSRLFEGELLDTWKVQ